MNLVIFLDPVLYLICDLTDYIVRIFLNLIYHWYFPLAIQSDVIQSPLLCQAKMFTRRFGGRVRIVQVLEFSMPMIWWIFWIDCYVIKLTWHSDDLYLYNYYFNKIKYIFILDFFYIYKLVLEAWVARSYYIYFDYLFNYLVMILVFIFWKYWIIAFFIIWLI